MPPNSDTPGSLEKIELVFYRAASGREPVRDWLKSLPDKQRKLIGQDLMRVQFRWPVGMPLVRPLKNGLYEVRTNIPDGVARVFIAQSGNVLVALHAVIKKTQKLDPGDLALARKRLKEIG